MSRKLMLVFFVSLFSIFAVAKSKGVFSAAISPSTTKHSDPEEIVTFTAHFTSQQDFDFVNIEWKFEGDIEVVSGPVSAVVNDVKADRPETAEVRVRIRKLEGAKIVFFVYKDVDGGARLGQTQIYVPQAFSDGVGPLEKSSSKAKFKGYQIKSKKIFQ